MARVNTKTILLLLGGGVILIAVLGAGVLLKNPSKQAKQEQPSSKTEVQTTTETLVPETTSEKLGELPAIEIKQGEVAPDGCIVIELNPSSWSPIYAAYTGGDDPLFQLHDNEPGFHFNAELYTVYGAGWTGQQGAFSLDCEGSGICVYLVPDDVNSYLANSGTVTIRALEQVGGSINSPVDVMFSTLLYTRFLEAAPKTAITSMKLAS